MENYLTVSALTKYIKVKLEGDQHLRIILIKGEISNFKHHSRGHFYFTLKDENAQISCIMFGRDTRSVQFTPKDGDHVLIVGSMSVYQPSGTYSIQVKQMKLDGIGELYLKYEALKKELAEKGWFDDIHKKKIPPFPKRIGVITSSTGAVIEDIKNTVTRRYLLTEIYLYPALVQGADSAASIARQIKKANDDHDVDVLIVGRGGGSIEDLWGFNEMPVIEAIFKSEIPVITAIGHETDFTLADFVSDLRAPTPTAAAELATPNSEDLRDKINDFNHQIKKIMQRYLSDKMIMMTYMDQRLEEKSPQNRLVLLKEKLERYDEALDKAHIQYINHLRQTIEIFQLRIKNPIEKIYRYIEINHQLTNELKRNIIGVLSQKDHSFHVLKTGLDGNNPLRLMDRGYSIIKHREHVVTSINDVDINDELDINLKDGILKSKVFGKKER